MNINLYIERLVLDGLPIQRRDGPSVKSAVEAELGRLLAADGLARSLLTGGAMPSLGAARIQMARDSNPSELGQQIARAVYGGIGK